VLIKGSIFDCFWNVCISGVGGIGAVWRWARLLFNNLPDFNAVGIVSYGEAFKCSDESSCVFVVAVDEFYSVVLSLC